VTLFTAQPPPATSPTTAQFFTRDPIEATTHQPYTYAADDPLTTTDPLGLWCLGSICTRFNPTAGLNALVNIGRGASFGLTDKIVDRIHPGASCTVPHNHIDQLLGSTAASIVGLRGAQLAKGLLARRTTAKLASRAAGEAEAAEGTAAAAEGVAGAEGPLALTRAGPNLTQQGLEHIVEHHWATSGAANAGKFAEGTTSRSLKSMIEDAVYNGSFRPNTMGRSGTIYEHDFGAKIGTDIGGSDTSWLRVVLGEDNTVITAFPFLP